ncbi:MAG TPA: hypothetical protein VF867_10030 [Arthrobacter sp.]
MTEHRNAPHPAVAFVKKNFVVLGLTTVLVGSVGAFAIGSMTPERTAAAAPMPSISSSATLEGSGVTPGGATASAGASAGATTAPSGASGSAGGSQAGAGTAGGSTGQQAGGATATTAPVRSQTTVTVGAAPQAPKIQDWNPVAKSFAAAWSNPGIGKDAWLAAMKPYVTASLYSSFQLTDIRSVPADKVTDVSSDRHSERTYIFTPRFASGTPRFTASITIQNDGSWLVDGVTPPEK